MYGAVLDTCVLVPGVLSDTLLRLAERKFYRPLWSDRIIEELVYAVKKVHPGLEESQIGKRIEAMNYSFQDALVSGWQEVSGGLDLPDDNDRHVLAAAIAGHAQSIVTFNLKDFPQKNLEAYGIEARHPDEFLLDQLDLQPGVVLYILQQQAADLKFPPSDLPDILNRLERCKVPQFADALRLLFYGSLEVFSDP